jgi:hypothetical protein
LRIPKLRQGSYFPPFLEPRKTAKKALVMVIQEAWIGCVSVPPGRRAGAGDGLPFQGGALFQFSSERG